MKEKHTPGPWEAKQIPQITHLGARGPRHFEIVKNKTRIASVWDNSLIHGTEVDFNARLIAIAPELFEEHKDWAKILGHIIVKALQKDYEYLGIIAKHLPIEYRDGEPRVKSQAIFKAEGEIVE